MSTHAKFGRNPSSSFFETVLINFDLFDLDLWPGDLIQYFQPEIIYVSVLHKSLSQSIRRFFLILTFLTLTFDPVTLICDLWPSVFYHRVVMGMRAKFGCNPSSSFWAFDGQREREREERERDGHWQIYIYTSSVPGVARVNEKKFINNLRWSKNDFAWPWPLTWWPHMIFHQKMYEYVSVLHSSFNLAILVR